MGYGTKDILNETFNATVGGANHFATAGVGHLDNAGWTGSLGSGSTLDADNTAITDPLGGSSEMLLCQKVSANFNASGQWDSGSEQAISYFHTYFQITAEGLGNGNSMPIALGRNASAQDPWLIQVNQSAGGVFRWSFAIYNNGAYAYTNATIALDQWYRLEAYYNTTDLLFQFRLDGINIASGALTGSIYNGPQYFRLGNTGSSYTATMYYDECYVSTDGYQTGIDIAVSECEITMTEKLG